MLFKVLSLISEKGGWLKSKLGILAVEENDEGLKISTYINNYEIENYFLKAIAFVNTEEYQSVDGARFMIKKTEVNGDVKVYSSRLTRNSKQ